MKCFIVCLSLLAATLTSGVAGHGRMLDPPQRSSLWRYNFSSPVNEMDDYLDCGYVFVQHNEINQGRCGECGDEWSIPRPRPNDEGGLYGNGIIGKTYRKGQLITTEIEVTISHKGWFEFRLCNKSSSTEMVTQECLDRNLLKLDNGATRFDVPTYVAGFHYPKVQLPADMTCENCVLQWYYHSANRVGNCTDGTQAVGCGDQETYVNCADITIN